MEIFRLLRHTLIVIPVIGLPLGLWLQWQGHTLWADRAFAAVALPVLGALVWEIIASLRRGDVGLDVVAALSMTAALVFGENLAAAVVALMYAGGQYLEAYADGRAKREMTALLARAPRTAMRYEGGGLREVPIEAIVAGDRLLVRQGDIVPVDGEVTKGRAVLDQSTLTGESLPVSHGIGASVMSGAANAGDAFDLVAMRAAADSTYAGIVRLVAEAQASKAPMARLADRYAMVFLAVTVAIAGLAWLLTGDPVRMVAVLVVATPCPLILAVPVAIAAGLSRAAAGGALVKGGKVLERLADIRTIVLDKTGTITHGEARLASTTVFNGFESHEVLRLAASLEQASQHVIARQIVAEAAKRNLALTTPSDVRETAGDGLSGMVEGRRIIVGGLPYVLRESGAPPPEENGVAHPGMAIAAVAVDGALAGILRLADGVREGVPALLGRLREQGIARVVLATGDRHEVAEAVAHDLRLDLIKADLTPEQKVETITEERRKAPTMMVGDGVNDAPALALADVGVAMGAKGAAASAQTADVVLLVDRLDGILTALRAARRSRHIALQSVYLGIGLSVAGMVAAAFGYLTPVQGALMQEVIDVAAILNALRALKDA